MSFMRSIRDQQSGNVFFALFGAVALVGVVGATSMQIMKGPVRSMSEVTKRTVAENNMIASAKLSLLAATSQSNDGDCDADGFVEPVPFENAGASPKPTGGGYLPASLGAALNDPWDTRYGYCVWDHGSVTSACGGGNFLAGANSNTGYAMAIISAGPDRTFNTSCSAYPSANALNKAGGSDDIVLGYTYAEAEANSGGLWNLKSGNPNVAEINKNLEVKDSGGTTTFALDSQTGIGDFIGVITATIAGKAGAPLDITGNVTFEDSGVAIGGACTQTDSFAFDGTADKLVRCNGATWEVGGADNLGNHTATQNVVLGSNWLSGDGGNEGIRVDATGNVGIGVVPTYKLSVDGVAHFIGGGGALDSVINFGVAKDSYLRAGTIGGKVVIGDQNTGNVELSSAGALTRIMGNSDVVGNATVGGTLGVTGVTTLTGAAILQSTATISGILEVLGSAIHNTGATPLYRMMNTAAASGSRGWQIQNNGSLYFGTTDDTYNWQDSSVLTLARNGLVSIGGELDMTSGKIINLADPIAPQEATTKAYVDARVAAGTGFVEQDPQVGTITTAGKWCQSDGTVIVCDKNDPTVAGFGDNLGNHIATQNVRFRSSTGGAGINVGGGSGDNLGAGGTTSGTLYSKSGSYGYVGLDGNDHIRFDDNTGAYFQINGVWEYYLSGTQFIPYTNNDIDFGNSSYRWKDGWFNGTMNVGSHINTTGQITANNASPTLTLQDTDHRSGYIHVNSNQMYFLTGANNAGYNAWAVNGSYWPIQIDLASDLVQFGGQLNLAEGNLNLGSYAVVGPAGTVIDAGGGWIRTYAGTGWYNGTFSGGIHMSDSNYVRTYGSKAFYALTANGSTPAVYGQNTSTNYGVYGQSAGNYGVYGYTASSGAGGVLGYAANSVQFGILGHANTYSFYGNGRMYSANLLNSAGGYAMCYNGGDLLYAASCDWSDIRLKEDIKPIDGALDKLLTLKGVSFEWKDEKRRKTDGKQIGLIAQDVEKVFPEVVHESTGDKGYKSLSYQYLVGPIIEGMRELKTQNDVTQAALLKLAKGETLDPKELDELRVSSSTGGTNSEGYILWLLLGVIVLQGIGILYILQKKQHVNG
ncbi:MAG: tail fiber domain-containing protein [Alphaproteobacteria bacterium]|nr:tail fiber domain-containing protein [Alphaproteobacteria bacterium]